VAIQGLVQRVVSWLHDFDSATDAYLARHRFVRGAAGIAALVICVAGGYVVILVAALLQPSK